LLVLQKKNGCNMGWPIVFLLQGRPKMKNTAARPRAARLPLALPLGNTVK